MSERAALSKQETRVVSPFECGRALTGEQKPFDKNSCDYQFKVVLVGDAGVGKTALANIMVKRMLSTSPLASGMYHSSRIITFPVYSIYVEVWDTTGSGTDLSKVGDAPAYFEGAHAVIIVFDITNYTTFHTITRWIDTAIGFCDDRAILFIVGNKDDDKENRTVTISKIKKFARKENVEVFETSALDASGVESVFITIMRKLVAKTLMEDDEENVNQRREREYQPSDYVMADRMWKNLWCAKGCRGNREFPYARPLISSTSSSTTISSSSSSSSNSSPSPSPPSSPSLLSLSLPLSKK